MIPTWAALLALAVYCFSPCLELASHRCAPMLDDEPRVHP